MADVHTNSPTREIAEALQGIDFPATRQVVVDYARKHGAADGVLTQLGHIPDREYESMADVFAGFGQRE